MFDRCTQFEARAVALGEALGCVTAESVVSAVAVPPFANTAMDGFAVRAVDVATAPVELRVVATLAAGAEPTVAVGPGEAIRIMTGAAIPPGADAVVPKENTIDGSTSMHVVVTQRGAAGDCLRPPGEDVALGQEVFGAATVLGPGHLGVLASLGLTDVAAFRRARVGVLSTGDELVEAPLPLRVGQIRDSNRHTLLGLVRRLGCDAVDLGLARDDDAVIETAMRNGIASCDAIVTSGGVSVGDFDYVKVVLDRLAKETGEPMRWMQIAIKPAKPLAFGVIGGRPVFGLPGNPVSSMVSFELFARPALRKMMGHPAGTWGHVPINAIADDGLLRSPDGKTHFVRVGARFEADGRLHVHALSGQASNLLRSMALANALAVLPDGAGVAPRGDVEVMLLS